MSVDPEAAYDSFLVNLEKIVPNVDMELALQVLLYERKMRDVNPAVELEIHYKPGTDREGKRDELLSKHGFAIALQGQNKIFAKGNMSLHTIKQISDDPSIEEITGTASIASY